MASVYKYIPLVEWDFQTVTYTSAQVPLRSDSFTRADTTPYDGLGGPWFGGNMVVLSNAATYRTTLAEGNAYTWDYETADSGNYTVEAVLKTQAVQNTFAPQLIFRGTSDGDYYAVEALATTYVLAQYVGYGRTVKGTLAQVPANADVIRAACSGAAVTVSINGVAAITIADAIAATTGVRFAVFCNRAAAWDSLKLWVPHGEQGAESDYAYDYLFCDSFTRADQGEPLGNRWATPDQGTYGHDPGQPVWTIEGGLLKCEETGGYLGDVGMRLAAVVSPYSDCTLELQLAVPGTMPVSPQGILFRLVDYATDYWWFANQGDDTLVLKKKVANVITSVASVAQTFAPGDELKVVLLGSSIKCYLNDVLKFDVTDAALQTAKIHGCVAGSPTSRLDNFRLWTTRADLADLAGVASTTTYYYSRGEQVTTGGHVYVPRILELSGVEAQYLDRKERRFGELSVTLDNLADDWTSTFPFQAIDTIDDFEDNPIRVYLYDAVADTKTLLWYGITKRPSFDPERITVQMTASFLWDAVDIELPAIKFGSRCPYPFGGSATESPPGSPSVGCPYPTYGSLNASFPFASPTSCDKSRDGPNGCQAHNMERFDGGWPRRQHWLHGDRNNIVDTADAKKFCVPLLYSATEFKVRPEIYRAILRDGELLADFILSGTNVGLPFDAGDLTAARVKLFHTTKASSLIFKTGAQPQGVEANLTQFPDGLGHSLVALAGSRTPLTKAQADKVGHDLKLHSITARPAKGRKLARTSAASSNYVYILEDLLRDPVYGLGLPSDYFDATALGAAANYVGTRYTARIELDQSKKLVDLVQTFLATFHGYLTWNGGVCQIGVKRNDESPSVTFGTGGRQIIDSSEVATHEADFSEITNELHVHYRSRYRERRRFVLYDKGAQLKAGNGIVKKTSSEIFLIGITADDEAMRSAAIWMREEINLNLVATWKTGLEDALDVSPGAVVRVNSPHIFNNTSNYLFRVIGKAIDFDAFTVTFTGRVYKQSVYADTAEPFNSDVLRGEDDTSNYARPPDVTGLALATGDVYTDDDGRLVRLTASWTYPTVSAGDQGEMDEEGIAAEYPVEGVELFWRYSDESINDLKRGPRVSYPTAAANWAIDYHRSRSVEVWAVALGRNNAHAQVGYAIDPLKVVALLGAITATQSTFVYSGADVFTADDYVRCEQELARVSSVNTGTKTVTCVNVAGTRTAQLDTLSAAHPTGTEIGVATKSHPTATLALAAPRFTYPTVTGVVQKKRRAGIRFRWTDVDRDNVETYLLYWTTDAAVAAASLRTADLAAYAPAWYVTDPLTPPAGISLTKTRGGHRIKLTQEEIGGTPGTTTVYGRVVAKNRGNYSALLSAMPATTSYRSEVVDLASVDEVSGVLAPGSLPADVAYKDVDNAFTLPQTGQTPTLGAHLGTKDYIDAATAGRIYKDTVRVATTANLATLSGLLTVDSVALSAADRVLVKDQTTGQDNGIYAAAAGAWARTTDADTSAEVKAGTFVPVAEGTANADSAWMLTTNDPITLGTTPLVFTRQGTVTPHNLLSSSHADTVAGSPVRGDIQVANATPAWARRGVGAVGTVWQSDGTDPSYALLVNANVDGAAGISWTKVSKTGSSLADLTTRSAGDLSSGSLALARITALAVSRAVASDGSGFLAVSTTTAAELDYVHGVTSAIQTQLDAKQAAGSYQPLDSDLTALAGLTVARGALIVGSSSPAWSAFAIGAANTVLTAPGADPAWALIANANVSGTAAIAYGKLALAGTLVDADVAAAAAIAWTKVNQPARQTITYTTASLASGATELATVTLYKSYTILRITTDRVARVRCYSSVQARTADTSRAFATAAINGRGLVLDVLTQQGLMTLDVSPQAHGSSTDAPNSTAIPFAITNNSGATSTVTVTLVVIARET